jgi:hypothetical protein
MYIVKRREEGEKPALTGPEKGNSYCRLTCTLYTGELRRGRNQQCIFHIQREIRFIVGLVDIFFPDFLLFANILWYS